MNPFSTLTEMCFLHKIVLPSPRHWWLLSDDDCRAGEINAVHSISGLAVATNGIMLAILTGANQIDFGHRQWFVEYEREPVAPPKQRASREQQRRLKEYE